MSLVDVRCRDVLAAHVTLRELVDAGPESFPVAIDRFHLLAGGLEDAVVHQVVGRNSDRPVRRGNREGKLCLCPPPGATDSTSRSMDSISTDNPSNHTFGSSPAAKTTRLSARVIATYSSRRSSS